jgi:hypothetical protein
MTSPLPTQHSKSTLEESKNSQKGDFLDFCVPQKSKETASFESLIEQNDQRQERADELEEAAAAKKRKKAVDVAAIAAPTLNSGNLQPEACLDLTQDPMQLKKSESEKLIDQDIFPNPPLNTERNVNSSTNLKTTAGLEIDSALVTDLSEIISSEKETQKENQLAQTIEDAVSKSVPDSEEEREQTATSALEDSKDPSSGMKSAASEHDMVSLATFEDFQASPAPKAAGELSITSTNRLSVMPSLSERAAISSTENIGAGGDTPSENFSTGNPALMATNGNFAFQKTAASQASSLLKSLAPEIERFQQTGHSQVQLELPVGDNESVKIRLSLRGGEIRSTFITESPELREALQKAWPDFTANHRAQGVRFGDSQFQDSFAHNHDAASDQGRQREYQREALASDVPSKQQQSKSSSRLASQSLPNNKTSSSSINLWA